MAERRDEKLGRCLNRGGIKGAGTGTNQAEILIGSAIYLKGLT